MAGKKNKKSASRNDVTLATETKATKKKAMIQQINDLGTEDIMTVIHDRPVAKLGMQELGMEGMTNMLVPKKGYEFTFAGIYHSGRGENPLKSKKDRNKKDGRILHTGDAKFRKKGKEFVSIPVSEQRNPNQYRETAAEEYLHAGQSRLPKSAKTHGMDSEAVATYQGTKSPHKAEAKAAWGRYSQFKNPIKAHEFGKKWLPIQNKAAKKLLAASRKHPKGSK